MTNRHTIYLHGDYLDGDLSPDETARVEEHLEKCTSCREDLDRLKRLIYTLRNIEGPDPGEGYFDNLLATVVARTDMDEHKTAAEVVSRPAESGTKGMLRTLIRLAVAVTLLFTAFYVSDFSQRQKTTGWANRATHGGFVDYEAEPIIPADYLPAGITTGIPYSADTNNTTVDEPSDTNIR